MPIVQDQTLSSLVTGNMLLRGWLSPLVGLALLVGSCAQHELHEEGMPDGLEVLDFTSEEEMDRVLFDPEEGIANFK